MFVEAVAAFQKAVSLSPDDPETIAGLGHAYAVVRQARGCAENRRQLEATIAAETYPILGHSNDLHRPWQQG